MTQREKSSAVIEVRGAWHGQTGDPGRSFAGLVTASEVPEVRAGESVVVTYRTAPSRTTGADQHGTYTLDAGGRTLPLMSFTCHATGTPGQAGKNDTAEALWQAFTLPGPTGRGG